MIYSDDFLTFWRAYPRRTAKADAWKAFQQVIGETTLDAMLAALAWQSRQPQWVKDDGQFIPYPASWLRGRRFEDEPVEIDPVARAIVAPARPDPFLDAARGALALHQRGELRRVR